MRRPITHPARLLALVAASAAVLGLCGPAAATPARSSRLTVVGYTSEGALRAALDESGATLVRKLPKLRVAEVRTQPAALRALSDLRGVRYAHAPLPRHALVEPGLAPAPVMGGAYEWQYAVSRENLVPASVLQAASAITVAVVDTGGDVTAPDLAAKNPATWSVLGNSTDVTDVNGHGTFVSSLAAGAGANGDGIAGFGGDAKLLVVQAGASNGTFTDVDEAAGIEYAVDHGAKVINMSFGGTGTSPTEQAAIDYAVSHGVLLVAAAGNDGAGANLPLYPAALLQPLGSNGQGGVGLAVGASTILGARASFSNYGSYISLAAPGEQVFGDVSSAADPVAWNAQALPGSTAGLYAYGSGTSFASPEVAGVAALVWAANPLLSAQDVATVLKQSATGGGTWNQETGYGVLDAAAAVARAQGGSVAPAKVTLDGTLTGAHVALNWSSPGAVSYTLSVSRDGATAAILRASTTATSAEYDLPRGHSYAFTVSAVGPNGLGSVSAPFVVDPPVNAAALTLRAAARPGRTRRVQLWALLAPASRATGRAGRSVSLEYLAGRRWRNLRSATTSPTGIAMWTVKLPRGSYRFRARYSGADDLAAAVSRVVAVRLR